MAKNQADLLVQSQGEAVVEQENHPARAKAQAGEVKKVPVGGQVQSLSQGVAAVVVGGHIVAAAPEGGRPMKIGAVAQLAPEAEADQGKNQKGNQVEVALGVDASVTLQKIMNQRTCRGVSLFKWCQKNLCECLPTFLVSPFHKRSICRK